MDIFGRGVLETPKKKLEKDSKTSSKQLKTPQKTGQEKGALEAAAAGHHVPSQWHTDHQRDLLGGLKMLMFFYPVLHGFDRPQNRVFSFFSWFDRGEGK